MAGVENDRLIRHLAHELRQPLSGIESIAYYIDMIAGDADAEVQLQCERLRRMVQHAHWLVEDATLRAVMPGCCGAVKLGEIFMRLGAGMALHEERNLELMLLEPDVPVFAPRETAGKFCQHVLALYRDVAKARDPIRVRMASADGRVTLALNAAVESDLNDLIRALQPLEPGGGIREFMRAAGGVMGVFPEGGRLTLRLDFSAAE